MFFGATSALPSCEVLFLELLLIISVQNSRDLLLKNSETVIFLLESFMMQGMVQIQAKR